MKKVSVVLLQIFCFLGALLFLKLINYVPIEDNVVCVVAFFVAAYPFFIKFLLCKKYSKYNLNNTEEVKYILLPLLCTEIIMIIYYKTEISSLIREIVQINRL